eukprot:NODE_9008_length_386_cov_37.000000_g8115_i0.p2 GENE.NODE_9008_length_386_cov_37.000000_g8115_i0~~NODE_9008_length_386_cov_37.000000_g8115_i0.p2  ORF type:complete len:100 (-),score=6.89 NODE_9008_length_386_cov_37.000000_g8115_i0:85-384(-)
MNHDDIVATANVVVVHSVKYGGPAQSAGIESGDIIERWDAQSLSSETQFARCVQSSTPGQMVTVGIRNSRGETYTIPLTVGSVSGDRPPPRVVQSSNVV